jgi:hypothetical protein
MRELEAKNSRLKQMYAELSLENCAPKGSNHKNSLTPLEQPAAVDYLVAAYGLARCRPDQAVGMTTSTYYHPMSVYLHRQGTIINSW